MRYLLLLLPFLSFGQTTYLFDNFSGADNAAKWVTMRTTLISNGSVVDTVEFTSSTTYEWATRNHLDGVDGVVFQSTGSAKAILRITGDVNLISHTNGTAHSIDNATFQNLRFESTHTTASQDNDGGIINFSYGSGDNINFIDLEFTGASAGANAIKSFAGASSSYTNITMDGLDINNMGRMGVEFVNHLLPVTTARYNNLILRNSTIQNTGLIEFGMGCSFSGYITNVTIENNVFVNNPNCGVELIGVDGGTVDRNNYSGTGDAQHTVRNSAPELSGATVPNRNINITNDVSTSVGTFSIIGAENITFTNCSWTGQRRGYAQNFANIQFIRCTFETVGQNSSLVSTPLVQALTAVNTLTGDISPNTNIDFSNCIIRAVTNDVNFIDLAQGTSTVECSEAYFLSASRMNATTVEDVDYYINDVFDSEIGDTGATCGVIGYVTPSTSQINRSFYEAFFDN